MKELKERIEAMTPLNEQEWRLLINSGDAELMQRYFEVRKMKTQLPVDAEIKLAKSGNVKMMKVYAGEFDFSEEAVSELIKTGNVDMIKAYLEENCFSADNELEFVRLGNNELIDFYYENWGFYPPAEDELEKLRSKAK